MTTEVIKSIGTTSRDYSTIASWNSALPTNLTTSRTSTIGSGSTTGTIVLDASASGTNSFYVGHTVTDVTDNPGQLMLITAYVGSTKVATIGSVNGGAATWGSAPTAGSTYVVEDVSWTGQLYADSTFTLTSGVSIASGVTVGASNIVKLTTGAGQSWIDNFVPATSRLTSGAVAGVLISCGTAYVVQLKVNGSSTIVEKTQHASSNLTSTAYPVVGTADANRTAVIRNVSIYILNTGTCFGEPSLGSIFENCLATDRTSAGAVGFAGSYGAQFHNCTAVRPSNLSSGGIGFKSVAGGTNPTVKNCASFGFATCYSGSWAVANNNASSDATAPGTSSQLSKTFSNQYVQPSNAGSVMDFTVKAGSDLANNGVRDQTFTNDLDVALRPRSTTTPTIGAYEFIGTASAISVRVVSCNQAVNRASTY